MSVALLRIEHRFLGRPRHDLADILNVMLHLLKRLLFVSFKGICSQRRNRVIPMETGIICCRLDRASL